MRPLFSRVFLLFALAAPVFAAGEEARLVYLVLDNDASSTTVFQEQGLLPADAARWFVPSRFDTAGKKLVISSEGEISFAARGKKLVERSDTRSLWVYDVLVSGTEKLPKPDKKFTRRFSLADLVKKGGANASSPAGYAVHDAIAASGFKNGLVWLGSVTYDGRGRFTAIVYMKR